MSLLDDMRVQVRVSGSATDGEIDGLIAAALADMERVGVDPTMLDPDAPAPLVRQAVACYVKSLYGFDNADAARLMESYRQIVCDLLNSGANVSARRCAR